MERRGLGSWLLIPIGMGDDYLGTMGLGRVDGGPRWIDSEINAAAAVASDVAGLVLDARLMERERTLNQELRDITDYRRDMVITLAHELRNPVSVLWTHLELLVQDPASGAGRSDSLAAMDRAARRIEDMIEDLMALATGQRPATGHAPRARGPLGDRPGGLRLPGAGRRRGRAGVRDQHRRRPARQPATPAGLQRMAANLLSNAFKYTPPGGRVTLSLAREAVDGRDGVQLVVRRRRDRHRRLRGRPGLHAVLPLAAARRRASARARAWDWRSSSGWSSGTGARSTSGREVGEGTTFTVWLPLSPVDRTVT